MKNAPFSWARRVDEGLQRIDKIPLFGYSHRIDSHLISQLLSARLNAPTFSIEVGDCFWAEAKKIQEGIGSNVMSISIGMTPLSGNAIWMMGREDMTLLTSWLMTGKTRQRAISSEALQEGFYRYLITEVLDEMQEMEELKELSFHIVDESEPEPEDSYCIDVKLSFQPRSCWGRLVLPATIIASWQRHFSLHKNIFSLSKQARDIELMVSVDIGMFSLTPKEWQEIQVGDVVILDRCGYEIEEEIGVVTMSLGGANLFYARIKNNQIELIDRANYYEDAMKKESSPKEEFVAIQEVPLNVSVELAQLKMTVEQLMQLSPGNLLELPIRPNQEVLLTMNGQKLGRGELVNLGETMGVRVLEIA